MSCGTSYVVGANFCSVCGARLSEVNHKIIEQPQEITSYVKCEHCETQNDSRSSYCEKCGKPLLRSVRENGKPSKRRISKAMFVIAITSALIISYFGVDYYIKFKADEEAKRIKEEYRQAKIDAALKDPSLYWYINFSSPTVGYSYSIRTASTYNTGVYLDNVKCVIVGIKVIKSSNSIYYLDDSIDGGKINLKSSEFTLNGLNPTIDSTGKNVCWRAYRDFNIVSSFNLSLYNTQTANFLFIIDMRSQISNVFFWRSKTIKILSDLFD
jgi:ribosomal protein L40E